MQRTQLISTTKHIKQDAARLETEVVALQERRLADLRQHAAELVLLKPLHTALLQNEDIEHVNTQNGSVVSSSSKATHSEYSDRIKNNNFGTSKLQMTRSFTHQIESPNGNKQQQDHGMRLPLNSINISEILSFRENDANISDDEKPQRSINDLQYEIRLAKMRGEQLMAVEQTIRDPSNGAGGSIPDEINAHFSNNTKAVNTDIRYSPYSLLLGESSESANTNGE